MRRITSPFILQWTAGGMWQLQGFDTEEELKDHVEAFRPYYFDPEWSRRTRAYRLEEVDLP